MQRTWFVTYFPRVERNTLQYKIRILIAATKAKYDDKKACGHMGAFLVACLNTQLFKNCPQSAWKDGEIFFGFESFFLSVRGSPERSILFHSIILLLRS